jgi:hypothetical protein
LLNGLSVKSQASPRIPKTANERNKEAQNALHVFDEEPERDGGERGVEELCHDQIEAVFSFAGSITALNGVSLATVLVELFSFGFFDIF